MADEQDEATGAQFGEATPPPETGEEDEEFADGEFDDEEAEGGAEGEGRA